MEFTVAQLAERLGGTVTGNGDGILRSIGRIEEAGAGELAFLSNPLKYGQFVYDSRATAILVPQDFRTVRPVFPALVAVPDVQQATTSLLRLYAAQQPRPAAGVDARAYVDETATIDPTAHIGPFAYVGAGARIGARTVVEPHGFIGAGASIGVDGLLQSGARLLHGCRAGDRVRLLANAVVGADGFGHTRDKSDKSWTRIPHLGYVLLEDDVEVGACATVDRAVTGATILRRGVKLDNLVMVAHNVVVDEHTAAAAQVGIAGSARIGKRVLLGGQVGMAGHITIADDVEVAAQSGIKDSVSTAGQKIFGSPAKPFREWAADQAAIRNVERLERRIRQLEQSLSELHAAAATAAAGTSATGQ